MSDHNSPNKDLNSNDNSHASSGGGLAGLTKEMLKKLDPIEEASKQAETIDSPRVG